MKPREKKYPQRALRRSQPHAVSPREAAAVLGICEQTVWRMLRKNVIPASKTKRRWEIRIRDLQRSIDKLILERMDAAAICKK
jgi:excisionase family DNA binding protein